MNGWESSKAGDPERAERRLDPKLEVIDTKGKLTDTDLAALKDVARYWQTGKLVGVLVLTLGGLSLAIAQLWDVGIRWLHR